jgi:hypothetical protein
VELIAVARSQEAMLNGVAVSPQGRVFSSFPRWTEKLTPGVAEAMPDGSFRPFPGGAWNEWMPGQPTQDRFVNVHSVYADRDNNLWVIDDSAPHHQTLPGARPKIVKIDLGSNKVARVFPLDEAAAPAGAILGHMRVDGRHAFVTESHGGAILVLDLETGTARRLLSRDKKTRADPSIVPVIDGKEFRRASDGKTQTINANLLELSADRGWLYFMALFGPGLYRIKTKDLLDCDLGDEELGRRIEDFARIPPCAGITVDKRGNLYFSSFTENAIATIGADRQRRIVMSDPRISFPNEGCVGPDDCIYFPASQAHRIAMFQTDGVSRVKTPWEVLKIKLS